MPQPLIELGGADNAPVMHLATANGFVPQSYNLFTRHFTPDYHVVSLPPRVLWGEGAPPPFEEAQSWSALADDFLTGIKQYGLSDIVAIGHSFGGIATLLAALKEPHHFKALILLDPTILPEPILQAIRFATESHQHDQMPLVAGALRRRKTYPTLEDGFEHLRPKSLFADWSDDALRLYLEHGTQATESGERHLTWSADWEAYYFGTAYTDSWDMVPQLTQLTMPMLFLAGGDSDTYTPDSAQKVADLIPNATHQAIEGYGHLFPQANPDESASIVKQWMADNDLL